MTAQSKPTAQQIKQARIDNPKMRERDLSIQLGVSEVDLVAAHIGDGVRRIEPRVADVLRGLEAVGEVMALTRNESAVHEKIGVYDKVIIGERASMVLSPQIDLRIFPSAWVHGFAVEKKDGEGVVRRSVQFFDRAGNAVHKVHLRPESNVGAYEALVASLISEDQSQEIETSPIEKSVASSGNAGSRDELRQRWEAMTDVHQFFGILKDLNLDRRQALGMVGQDFAWQLDVTSIEAMFNNAVNEEIPIMCFVGNQGCVQIHSGPIKNIKTMGPWLNVLDETFHLHLRADHVNELWAVRKPTKDGHVTSLEAYDVNGEMIIQFFGKRHEGNVERADWRLIAENLPRIPVQTAA